MRMMNSIAKIGPTITMKRSRRITLLRPCTSRRVGRSIKAHQTGTLFTSSWRICILERTRAVGQRNWGCSHLSYRKRNVTWCPPLKNKKAHGTLGNFHRIGSARLQTMFNDGGKGSGTAEDLAIEERMRIATEGVVVVDFEVIETAGHAMDSRARVTAEGCGPIMDAS